MSKGVNEGRRASAEKTIQMPCALCGETLDKHEFITYYKSSVPDEQQAYMCPGVIDSCQFALPRGMLLASGSAMPFIFQS